MVLQGLPLNKPLFLVGVALMRVVRRAMNITQPTGFLELLSISRTQPESSHAYSSAKARYARPCPGGKNRTVPMYGYQYMNRPLYIVIIFEKEINMYIQINK